MRLLAFIIFLFYIHSIFLTHLPLSFLSLSSFPHFTTYLPSALDSLLCQLFLSSFPSTFSHYSSFCLSPSISALLSTLNSFHVNISPQFLFQFPFSSFSLLSLHLSYHFLIFHLTFLYYAVPVTNLSFLSLLPHSLSSLSVLFPSRH